VLPIKECLIYAFLLTKIIKISNKQEVDNISPEELRTLYNAYLEHGKQVYVAKVTGIQGSILSKFRTGKFETLYPHLAEKLEKFLLEN